MERRQFLQLAGISLLTCLVDSQLNSRAVHSVDRPVNVLLITIDDLRPDFGCYGHEIAKSPNIDRLAESGTTFTNAYCQYPLCGPTRASVFSGLLPDTTGIYDLDIHLQTAVPDVLTMPQFFRNRGYHTANIGRAFHNPADFRDSWHYIKGVNGPKWVESGDLHPSTEVSDVSDDTYTDGRIAKYAIEHLRKIYTTPFFMAIGFEKPHLPFAAPRKYWDLYDRDDFQMPDRSSPSRASEFTFDNSGELRAYTDIPDEGDLSDDKTRELIHGYYAALSYMDALVGSVLAEVDLLGIRENTLIVLWGDHGFRLGEYGGWGKRTLWDFDTHIPLIISMPGSSPSVCDTLVEALDIYPTLAELSGAPVPSHCQGLSIAELLVNPEQTLRLAVRSQCLLGDEQTGVGEVMGYSIRTEEYRYNEWIHVDDGTILDHELYDHSVSPIANENLATQIEHQEEITELGRLLRDAFGAMPSREEIHLPLISNV